MHELSICRQTLKQVIEIAQADNAYSVQSITLRIGPLSGVDARLLKQAFPFVAQQTLAENAQLIIYESPVLVKCVECGSETRARVNDLRCKLCSSEQTQLLSGDEMLLVSIELESHTTTNQALDNNESLESEHV